MLMTPWQTLKALWRWFVGREVEAPAPPTAPAAPPPKLQHYIRSNQIVAGNVIVLNTSDQDVRLEGPVLRSLFIRAGGIVTVKSPLLEPVWRIKSVVMEDVADDPRWIPRTKSVDKEIAFVNEWDGLEVVENMIEEYVRSRAYDLLSPEDLKYLNLPLEKNSTIMESLYEKIGLKAQRENENIPAQA